MAAVKAAVGRYGRWPDDTDLIRSGDGNAELCNSKFGGQQIWRPMSQLGPLPDIRGSSIRSPHRRARAPWPARQDPAPSRYSNSHQPAGSISTRLLPLSVRCRRELPELDRIADEDLDRVVGGDIVTAVGNGIVSALGSAFAKAEKIVNTVVKGL